MRASLRTAARAECAESVGFVAYVPWAFCVAHVTALVGRTSARTAGPARSLRPERETGGWEVERKCREIEPVPVASLSRKWTKKSWYKLTDKDGQVCV